MYHSNKVYKIVEKWNEEDKRKFQLLISVNYSYPNICQVCFRHTKEIPLKRCQNCNITQYCGSLHKNEDFERHKDFCLAVLNVRQELGYESTLFPYLKDVKDSSTKYKEANRIEGLVQSKMSRKFYFCEVYMMKFPRV